MKKYNNIFIDEEDKEVVPFISANPGRSSNKYPNRNRFNHGNFIKNKLEHLNATLEADTIEDGFNIEFSSKKGYDLKIQSLENIPQGIRLLNVIENDGITTATVFVPAKKKEYFLKKVNDYLDISKDSKKPKNNDLINSIEDVKKSIISSFWIGDKKYFPNSNNNKYEIIIETNASFQEQNEDLFLQVCNNQAIEVIDPIPIRFPERTVFLVEANIESLSNLITNFFHIAEIRPFIELDNNFFVKDLDYNEKIEWCNDLLKRCNIKNSSNVYGCLLDTGVIQQHPLLKNFINSNHINTINSAWNLKDNQNHGTPMAGIALFNDLYQKLSSNNNYDINYGLESVKIYPDSGSNLKEQYGNLTRDALNIAEINNPNVKRLACLAVTEKNENSKGNPSVWSAAIDDIAYGNYGNDKILFLISAGNVLRDDIRKQKTPDCNYTSSIYSPGQSWNALTVGAYTEKININDDYFKKLNFKPISISGELSPTSRTSLIWDKAWPIKPEIVCEGGNWISNGSEVDTCDNLSLLTTSNNLNSVFTTFGDTSCATALATNIALELNAKYEHLWPETIRALIVHSARWTKTMKEKYKTDNNKKGYYNLLRTCGYGVPSLERAMWSYENNVNMIIQSEIKPFKKIESKFKTNEMHFYELPWPKELLQSLGDMDVSMRVTLSYFIEPALGENGWKNRYRYASCGLRFEVKNTDESKEDFQKRINKALREEDNDKGMGSSGSERWLIGKTYRDVGSIHSDVWKGNAIDLSNCNYIAVYPTIGWWRERHNLNKYNNKIRYSLIVSLETAKEEIDLYTPIITQIENKIATKIKISNEMFDKY